MKTIENPIVPGDIYILLSQLIAISKGPLAVGTAVLSGRAAVAPLRAAVTEPRVEAVHIAVCAAAETISRGDGAGVGVAAAATTAAGASIASRGITIPVDGSITKALADSHQTVAPVLGGLDQTQGELLNGRLVDVVGEGDVLVGRGVGADGAVEDVLAVGDVALVVEGVDVPVDDVIAEVAQVGEALAGAAAVRRAHVGGEVPAEGVLEDLFVLRHVASAGGGGEGVEVWVVVGMGAELVAVVYNAAQDIGVWCLGCVSPVEAVGEEGGLDLLLGEEVKELVGVEEGAIVECEGDGARGVAVGDGDAFEKCKSSCFHVFKLSQRGAYHRGRFQILAEESTEFLHCFHLHHLYRFQSRFGNQFRNVQR